METLVSRTHFMFAQWPETAGARPAVAPDTAPELFVSMAKGADIARAEAGLLKHGVCWPTRRSVVPVHAFPVPC